MKVDAGFVVGILFSCFFGFFAHKIPFALAANETECEDFLRSNGAAWPKINEGEYPPLRIALGTRGTRLLADYRAQIAKALPDLRKRIIEQQKRSGVPLVDWRTWDVLARAQYRETNHRGTPMNAGINPDSIRRALLADSYFIWLNENAENLPFAGVRHQPFWHEPALGDTRFVAFAPRELMEAHATTGSLNYLPYELAWLRIVRDFDPTIDPQTRRLAHAILQFYKTYVAILRIFNRLEAIDSPLVWALAFTSEKAKDSRERLDFLIKQHFSQHFPEAYWERVQQAIEREEPFVLKSVCALLDAKLPSQRLEVLDYLRERLGLPANLNVELLHSAIMMGANGEEEAFVQFLVRNDPEIATRFREPEIGLIYNQILQITELDQAFQERRFGFMVEDELGRVPFSY